MYFSLASPPSLPSSREMECCAVQSLPLHPSAPAQTRRVGCRRRGAAHPLPVLLLQLHKLLLQQFRLCLGLQGSKESRRRLSR